MGPSPGPREGFLKEASFWPMPLFGPTGGDAGRVLDSEAAAGRAGNGAADPD